MKAYRRAKTDKSTSSSNVKILLTAFFDCNGVVYHKFLPQVHTVNKEYYLEVMRQLRITIHQKCTELWKNQSWILHHDNAPAHTSMLVCEFLVENKTVIMPQQPYSPNFFPKLRTPMKEERFAVIEEVKEKSKQELLTAIPKSAFPKCFVNWKKRRHKCIISEGSYFEGQQIVIDK